MHSHAQRLWCPIGSATSRRHKYKPRSHCACSGTTSCAGSLPEHWSFSRAGLVFRNKVKFYCRHRAFTYTADPTYRYCSGTTMAMWTRPYTWPPHLWNDTHMHRQKGCGHGWCDYSDLGFGKDVFVHIGWASVVVVLAILDLISGFESMMEMMLPRH